jgi:UDP-N-acetylglucosamine/UDP-N-acetylgalactosamine diphosphorylase
LQFRAGSPAIHLFNVEFLERVTAKGTGLNFHVARKVVPYYEPTRETDVQPEKPNALKFEMFIFDALPMAERWLAVETPRAEEFAPLKNATGVDSPETAKAAIGALHSDWLKRAGIDTHGHAVEISPLFALDADELRQKIPQDFKVTGPTYLR